MAYQVNLCFAQGTSILAVANPLLNALEAILVSATIECR